MFDGAVAVHGSGACGHCIVCQRICVSAQVHFHVRVTLRAPKQRRQNGLHTLRHACQALPVDARRCVVPHARRPAPPRTWALLFFSHPRETDLASPLLLVKKLFKTMGTHLFILCIFWLNLCRRGVLRSLEVVIMVVQDDSSLSGVR